MSYRVPTRYIAPIANPMPQLEAVLRLRQCSSRGSAHLEAVLISRQCSSRGSAHLEAVQLSRWMSHDGSLYHLTLPFSHLEAATYKASSGRRKK